MLSKYGKDSSVTQMVDKLDWVIMPVFNVDGYVFTQQVIQLKSHAYQKHFFRPPRPPSLDPPLLNKVWICFLHRSCLLYNQSAPPPLIRTLGEGGVGGGGNWKCLYTSVRIKRVEFRENVRVFFPQEQRKLFIITRCLYQAGVRNAGFNRISLREFAESYVEENKITKRWQQLYGNGS